MELEMADSWIFNGEQATWLVRYGLLFVLGTLAGSVNVLAGGGSFLTLPFLIFFDLPPSVANGTNRVGIFLQNVFAVWNFHRHAVMDWHASRWAGLPAVLGAPFGTWLAVSLPESSFQKMLAFLMVGLTLGSLWLPQPAMSVQANRRAGSRTSLLVFGFFLVGVYGGLVQAGVGFFILTVTSLLGFDLVKGNGIKVLTVLVMTSVSLPLFAWSEKIHWPLGLVLASGTVLGGWFGVKLTVLKGNQWLRRVVITLVVLFAIRLWLTA